jgi:hypothetical protein
MAGSGWGTISLDPKTPVDELVQRARAGHQKGLEVEFQYTTALPDQLMEAMAAVIDAAPDTSVRIYSMGDGGGPEFDWLRGLEKLRHLKVETSRAKSFGSLERFSSLRTLFLGRTISKQPSLSVLASLTQLIRLRVDGHVKGAEAIAELKDLRFLDVGYASDEQWLVRVGPPPALEQLIIGLGGIRDLSTLPDCPHLRSLRLVRVTGLTHEHLRPVAACRSLERLTLNQLKHVSRLPDLSGGPAKTLKRVVLQSMHNLETVRELASLQRLELLQITDTVPRDQRVRDFRNVEGLHLILDARYPDKEIQALLDGYRGITLEYRGELLIGTRQQRKAAAAALNDAPDTGPLT